MKYLLNPQFHLAGIDEIEILPEFEEEARHKLSHHILVNSSNGSIYLLTPIIYEFLNHFTQAKLLEEIYPFYAKNKNESDQIQFIIGKFVKQMLKKRILIREELPISFAIKTFKYLAHETINEYTITQCLANKSTVDIYKVQDANQNPLIIKLVHPLKFNGLNRFENAKKSLYQEYQFITKASSIDEVVRVHEYVDRENEAFFVMEYIEGKSLGKVIKQDKQNLSLESKLGFITQILSVFSKLHSENILHGDIHSSNFLVEKEHIRLIDFGLSQTSLPQENEIIKYGGVNYYMPPERVQANILQRFINRSTYQSEVYQLGILIYFILYGHTPFKALTWKSLAKQIMDQRPTFDDVADLDTVLSDEIVALIQKSMSKDPLDRFENANAFYTQWKKTVPENIFNTWNYNKKQA